MTKVAKPNQQKQVKKVLNKMNIVLKDLNDLKPYKNNPREITDEAIKVVKNSIKAFGIKVPLVIDNKNVIVCGHTRYKALNLLKLEDEAMMDFTKIPCVLTDDLSPSEINAFRIADNKTSEFSLWDKELLAAEVDNIPDIDLRDFGVDLNINDTDIDDTNEFEEKKKNKKQVKCPSCGYKFEI